MTAYDIDKLADARTIVDKLEALPQEALMYIAGYAEGYRDGPWKEEQDNETRATEKTPRP